MGILKKIENSDQEKKNSVHLVKIDEAATMPRSFSTSPVQEKGIYAPTLEEERANERDKMLTPSVSRQAGKTSAPQSAPKSSFGSRVASGIMSGLITEGANIANAGGVQADLRGGTEMSGIYREQVHSLDLQIAALEKTLKDPSMTEKDRADTMEALSVARSQRDIYDKAVRSGEGTAKGLYETADAGYRAAQEYSEKSLDGIKGIKRTILGVVPGATQIGVEIASGVAPVIRAISSGGANAAQYRYQTGDDYNAQDAATRMALSAGGVVAGGALSRVVNESGLKLLRTLGKQNYVLPNIALGGVSALGYAAGETGLTELSKAITDENYTPDWNSIGKTAVSAFAFGAITRAIDTARVSIGNKRYMKTLNGIVEERYNFVKKVIEDPRATAQQKARGAQSVMDALDNMLYYLDELQVVGAQKEVNAMREFLLSIYGEMLPYTSTNAGGISGAGEIVPVSPSAAPAVPVTPAEAAQPPVAPSPVAPAAAGRAAIEATAPKTVVPAPTTPAPVQKVPDLPLASEQGEQKAQAGEITPSTADVPQNAAQSERAPIANGFSEKQMKILSGTFGENGAKAFHTSMTDYPGNPIDGYAQFSRLYNEGKKRGKTVDVSPAEILKTIEETPALSPEQRYAAFVSGMNDASAAEVKNIAPEPVAQNRESVYTENKDNISIKEEVYNGSPEGAGGQIERGAIGAPQENGNGSGVQEGVRGVLRKDGQGVHELRQRRGGIEKQASENKVSLEMTSDESDAMLKYKSSESYKINEKLRDGHDLSENERKMINDMDEALKKLPKVSGRTYRTINFDDVTESEQEYNVFLSEHYPGAIVSYSAFTSVSTSADGYPLSKETVYGVILEIEGNNAHSLDSVSNNFEREALYPRNSVFIVKDVQKDENGKIHIYMQEDGEDGIERSDGQVYSEKRSEAVQSVQKASELYGDVREVPEKNSARGSVERELPAVQGNDAGKNGSKQQITDDVKNDSLGSARGGFDPYSKLQNEYGTIPEGEKPFRVADVPKKSTDGRKVSQTVRTVLEAEATPEAIIPNIEQLIVDNQFSYDTITNKETLEAARAEIENIGWESAKQAWFSDMRKNKVSPDLTARGWVFYNNAANSGDMELALKVLDAMVKHQRDAARALQATRILKSLSPETVLYSARKSVASLQEDLNKQYGKNDAPKLTIDQQLAQEYMDAKTDAEKDAALEKIYRDIGRQMPSRFIDKWNAWRYLSMLGNPRTHVRNIVGNAGFAPVVLTKDAIATAIETVVLRGSGSTRTKAFINFTSKADRELLSAAWDSYQSANKEIMEGGKYSDAANANRAIEEGRVIFGRTRSDIWNKTGGQLLETARKGNSKALDVEDQWFSQPHFAYALAQYAKANGITAEQIRNRNIPDAARAYAIKEAQKATYRDTNQFSQYISGLGRTMRSGESTPRKIAGTVLEGILPFRKTPANILARGVEYSPLGLMNGIKTLSLDMAKVKSNGEKNGLSADAIAQQQAAIAVDGIDKLAAGITGTGLLALGVYLAAQGLLRGRGGGDDDKREFEELGGHQNYSLELPDGTSVTLDWLAPESLALFIGANLYEVQQERVKNGETVTLSDTLTALTNVTEPMLEMTCLQSLNDVFDAVSYASSGEISPLVGALASAATSYLTQAIPTLGGQAERTSESVRMSTYTEKNAFLTSDMQYAIGRASARVPGFDYNQIPYIDAWGREEQTGAAGARAANNFVNPAYMSKVAQSDMEKELLRLYDSTGSASVFPSRAAKYFNVDGKRVDLDGETYVKYAKEKGQTAYNGVTALVGNAYYQKLSDEEKAEAVSLVYEYANSVAKQKVSQYKPTGWTAKAQKTIKETGISLSKYILAYQAQSGAESIKDKNGNAIENSASLVKMQALFQIDGVTGKQREALYSDFGVGAKVRHYNPALVKYEIDRMRGAK